MHPALRIPELLSEIFQYLADDWGRPCAALAGALTCKAFLSPALDALWNELPDIRPIIKLIPGIKTRFAYPHHLFLLDADDIQETHYLDRLLCISDLDRLQFYSRRVRKLAVIERSDEEKQSSLITHIDTGIFIQLLGLLQGNSLFPRLHSLQIMVAVRDDGVVNSSSPYLPLLLSPRLRELDLIFYGDHFLKPISQIQAANISVFLQAISTRTALDSLSWLTDSAPHDTIVDPISTIQTLTQLHLSINDRRHLIHLSTLSSLLTLHLNMAHASNNLEMSVAPKTSFSSLQTLYLHADFDSFNQITSLLRSPKLDTFSITLIDVSTPVDPASYPTWAQLFGRFPVQMPNLKILALKKQEDGDEVYLPWSACTELLKLQRLTIVDLSALFIMELSAEQFEDLPSTWKDLEDCIIPSDDGAVFEYFKPLSIPLTRVSFLSADL